MGTLRVGVIMGGRGNEKEVSFNSGRTVCDHLDTFSYDVVPIFQRSNGTLYILPWRFLHRGKTTDFEHRLESEAEKIAWDDLKELIDFMYIAMHGRFAEDGTMQGILEILSIPYLGSKVMASALGMDKVIQKEVLKSEGIKVPHGIFLKPHEIAEYEKADALGKEHDLFALLDKAKLQPPYVVKPYKEGSSIGISVVSDKTDLIAALIKASTIDNHGSQTVLIEEYIKGMEFTCISITDYKTGNLIPLPPTEIIPEQSTHFFDYDQKYMPGRSTKFTPARVSDEVIKKIQDLCMQVTRILDIENISRIDGFVTKEGDIVIIDPNTLSGMAPSSFLFRQAAELNMSHTTLINHLIETELAYYQGQGATLDPLNSQRADELKENIMPSTKPGDIMQNDTIIPSSPMAEGQARKLNDDTTPSARTEQARKLNDDTMPSARTARTRVGILLGGRSHEKEISLETGRNVFYKLSPHKYEPIALFVDDNLEIYHIDQSLLVRNSTKEIALGLKPSMRIPWNDLSSFIDFAFIGLHGGEGENGCVQGTLEMLGISYNGSSVLTSALCMDKYKTANFLKSQGFDVPRNYLVDKKMWEEAQQSELDTLIRILNPGFDSPSQAGAVQTNKLESSTPCHSQGPLIVKPHDDGCSVLVFKVRNKEELIKAIDAIFADGKKFALVEECVQGMELTVGVVGNARAQALPPSQAISFGDILSIEEKFLPGAGENQTPAPLPEQTLNFVKKVIADAYTAINCKGYARVDCFYQKVDDVERVVILEFNTLPGLTPATCIFHQAAEIGLKPMEFIDLIIELGFEEHSRRNVVAPHTTHSHKAMSAPALEKI